MRRFTNATLFFFIIFSSMISGASEITSLVNQAQDREAYEYVKSTCSSVPLIAYYLSLNTFDSAWDKLRAVKYFGHSALRPMEITIDRARLQEEINSRGLSIKVAGYLQTLGYYTALKECFPKSEAKRNIYTASLIFSDVLGVGLDLAVLIFSVQKMAWPAFRGVSQFPRAALSRLGVSQKAVDMLVGASLGITAVESIPPLAKSVQDFIAQWRAQKKAYQDEFVAQMEKVDELRDQYTESCFFEKVDPKSEVTEAYKKNKEFYALSLQETLDQFQDQLSISKRDSFQGELAKVRSDTIDCQKIWLQIHPEFQDFVKP